MPPVPPLEVTPEELEALLEGVREALGEAGYQKLKAAVRTLSYVTQLLENREATLQSLRRLLCRAGSEKTEAVLEQAGIPGSASQRKPVGEALKKPVAGHGRNGAQAYRGAHRIEIPHPSLHQGDRCPECQRGKVYPLCDPGLLVRMQGQAPIAATVYALEKLRCNLCGEVFTAQAPEGVGEEKYDATAASMVALLRYGSGFPWNRLADLEESLGLPLPAATQCEIVAEAAAAIQPAMAELIRQAAQGEVLHNDDTSMPVLALRRNANLDTNHEESDAAERTGVFTSGIVSTAQQQTIALFFTGRQHAGENLADARKHIADGRRTPVSSGEKRRLLEAFIGAAQKGDMALLEGLFAEDLSLIPARQATRSMSPPRQVCPRRPRGIWLRSRALMLSAFSAESSIRSARKIFSVGWQRRH